MKRLTADKLLPLPQFRQTVLGVSASERWAQHALMKAIDGLPMDAAERGLVETYTGRSDFGQVFRQVVILVGRQSGKSELGADTLVYEGVKASLTGDRGVDCIGIAQDSRSACAVLFGYVARRFDHPALASLVVGRTQNEIRLKGDVTITVLPCRPAAVRGRRARCVVMDEFCHFRNSENVALDREMWRAVLPALLTTGGKLVMLSSPYAASGLGHDLHRKYFGVEGSPAFVWQSPGVVLHPTLDAEFMAQIRAGDPEGARAELDGEFLQNVSALFDHEALMAAVDEGVTARAPQPAVQYRGFMDWATGVKAGNDAATLAIGHRTPQGLTVLDAVKAWAPPFSPAQVAAEAALVCRAYRVFEVVGDRFAQGFSDDACRQAGLRYRPCLSDKSELYLRCAAALASGQVRLLDHAGLLKELRGLERRRTPSRDRVDHRPGAHDDLANAAAGVVAELTRAPRGSFGFMDLPGL